MLLKPFSGKNDLKIFFFKNIHFGRLVVWCCVNQMNMQSIQSAIVSELLFILFFKSSWRLISTTTFNRNNSFSKPAVTTFAFHSIISFFYDANPEDEQPGLAVVPTYPEDEQPGLAVVPSYPEDEHLNSLGWLLFVPTYT